MQYPYLFLHNYYSNTLILSSVKQRHKKDMDRMQSDFDGAAESMSRQHEKKMQQLKDRLAESRQKTADEKTKWQDKLDKLDIELATAKDRIYAEKAKCRSLVQH